ncbi:unnamed protein product [Caenorhabditis auriculariae]|uniref:Uncharacterized protein n=1 Tax=Caenorhabditis auriculariae TaxID=2777116 RepID=A0A8S1GQU9_9PELO|nr:unnamed protein product [Caenorhabditis auriculariae]
MLVVGNHGFINPQPSDTRTDIRQGSASFYTCGYDSCDFTFVSTDMRGASNRCVSMALTYLLMISGQLVTACFLNSCPYRRYGRTLRCASCGPELQGICVQDGKCCTNEDCFPDDECTSVSVCPELFCKIARHPGYCMEKNYCCTQGGCQKSAMCI